MSGCNENRSYRSRKSGGIRSDKLTVDIERDIEFSTTCESFEMRERDREGHVR